MSRNRYDYSRKSYRNTGLLSHYHECASRVFANGRRPNEYLHNLFLSAAKNGEYERVENFLSRTTTSPINVDFKDKKTGNTAMILAASQNHGKVVSLLLNYGADITLSNDAGQSVLDMAPRSLIPLLIDSVERQGTSSRHLLQAAWQGNVQILKRLLSSPKKVDVNCTNADGMTPLLLVTRDINMFEQVEQRLDSAYNPIEVVQELLLHKADCSISGKEGRHALHQIATTRGPNAEKIASLLIKEGGCNPDILDGHRYSPIHLASKENNVPIVLALVDGGGDVNVRGCGGKTPLHIAASNGHQSVSGVLVENGADVTLVDDHGYSAMDVTSSQSVRRILREAWVGQTLKNKPRAHSAMPGLFQKPEDQLQLTKKGDHQENVESTEKFDPEDVIVNRSSSQSSNRTESRVPPLVTPEAKLLSPSPPKTGNRRSNRNKGTSLIGTIPESYGQVTQPRRTELPYLAVKNIELHIGRNPRSPLTVGSKCSRGTYIQRYRFYKSHSAPVPPETRRKRSLPGTPNTPLGPHGRSCLMEYPCFADALRAGSSCSRSLAKIFYPESQDDSQPPPPPPCDLQSEYLVDTRLYTTVDSRSNPIPESDLHTTLEDQTLISDSPSRTIQHQNELNNVDPTVNNRHDTMSNTFAHISSHDNKGDAPAADLQDSAFITFEISTHTLLHKEEQHHKKQNDIESNDLQEKQGTDNLETSAVSLSTQLPDSSTTTSKEVESSHKDDDERRTINVPSGDVIIKSLEKNSSANFVLVETQTFSAEKSPTFWIPYKGDEAPSVDSSTNTQNDSDSKRSRTSSSMTFFVHLNDNEDQDHVQVNKTFSKCRLCGEAITESTSSQCDRCSKKVADEKAFWVSLETQTKQEIGGDGSTELNETNRAETASLSIETIGIIRSSTFVKEENSEESTKTPEGCDSAPSGAVDKSIEPEYENKSAPKDTVDLLTQPAKGKQNSSKSTVAHNTEMVLRSFGLDNEYAIEQESEVQQGAVFENQEAPEESSTCISDPSKLREPPKSAWSTPRQEKSPSGLQICNPFPSPVPPINTIPPVQPPIGVQCSRPVTSAKKKGRGKSRTSTAKKRTNSGKECSRGSGSGGKNIKEQATKGKKKGKKKSKCKEIEVNQSAAGVACYGGGFIASAAYGCVEYALSPDLDSMPTLSLDPRAFSGRPARAAIVNLSPIPEVPTPSPSPNESLKSTCSRKGSLDGFSSTPVRTSTDGLEKEAAELDELITFLDDAEKEVDEENASKTSPSAVSVEKQSDANEGDFDVVDGGFISRFAGMCIPRLILLSRNSDSDDEDLLGKDELLAASPNTSPSEIPVSNICTKGESNDNGESVKAFVGSNVLPDEADDDIEGIVHNLIRDTEKTTQLNVTSPYSDAASTHGSDTTQELTSGNQFDTSTKDVVEKDSDDQPGDRLSKTGTSYGKCEQWNT
ncbi:predicted protein [Nematostella vectensis]|uniref:Uncharacterized protein n=1 Tax=Nematostella vectensis TaxID=45351 RepID=A7RL87_NEMVE|nr:predicted protein [Nematostella vectensis]|eukprot:XP_001639883.1 predicted protein [Nematostella vectensis]